MKWLFILSAFAIFACSGSANKKQTVSNNTSIKKVNSTYTSVAVLELFTSEGCSSCPPADNLLPQLAKLDSNIIHLSFHVDYWNRLGWTDPFSSSEFSDRQRKYGEQFHLEGVYTPQLVINGEYELVGSNRNTATSTIKKVLAEKAAVQIKIDEVKKDGNKLIVTCEAEGNLKKSDLLAALVQKQAVMNVKAGENSGAKLSHTNVVRSFAKQTAAQKTSFTFEMPSDVTDDNWKLIIYAQQKNDLKITGAAEYKNK
jgi:hypothetical protein